MSKRHSKTKAAGALCGMARCQDYKFKQAGNTLSAETVQNRQMRRLMRKSKPGRERQ